VTVWYTVCLYNTTVLICYIKAVIMPQIQWCCIKLNQTTVLITHTWEGDQSNKNNLTFRWVCEYRIAGYFSFLDVLFYMRKCRYADVTVFVYLFYRLVCPTPLITRPIRWTMMLHWRVEYCYFETVTMSVVVLKLHFIVWFQAAQLHTQAIDHSKRLSELYNRPTKIY